MRVFDTRELPPRERLEALEQVLGSGGTGVQVQTSGPTHQVHWRNASTQVGAVTVETVWCGGFRLQRTATMVADHSPPRVCLSVKLRGGGLVAQHGREMPRRAGDIALFCSTGPFEVVTTADSHQHVFWFPFDHLALPRWMVHEVAARWLDPRDPYVQLTSAYFRTLATTAAHLEGSAAETAGQAGVDLVRALVVSRLPDAKVTREAADRALGLRVVEYLRAHWADPDISAARIAAEHHISVRHVYNLLAEAQISLGEWVRARRLEACRRELAGQAADRLTIAAVGRRWGFSNATHFGRAFKAAYGMTPREWRALQLDDDGRRTPDRRELSAAAQEHEH